MVVRFPTLLAVVIFVVCNKHPYTYGQGMAARVRLYPGGDDVISMYYNAYGVNCFSLIIAHRAINMCFDLLLRMN